MDGEIGADAAAVSSDKFTRVRSTDGRRVRTELLFVGGNGREAEGARAR